MLSIFNPDSPSTYDMREVLARIIDISEFVEYKKDYGKTLICGNAKIDGYNVGIVANQRFVIKDDKGALLLFMLLTKSNKSPHCAYSSIIYREATSWWTCYS